MNAISTLLLGSLNAPLWIAAMTDVAAKGLLLMALGAAAVALLRRGPAAARHAVWAASLASLLLLSILSPVLPGWNILPAWAGFSLLGPDLANAPRASAAAAPFVNTSGSLQVANPSGEPGFAAGDSVAANGPAHALAAQKAGQASMPYRVALPWLLSAVWLAGAMLVACRTAASQWSLVRLSRRSRRLVSGRVFDLHQRLKRQLGISRPATLLHGPSRAMPMAWGVFHDYVFLPSDALAWSPEQLRCVLLHELTHLKRRDPAVQMLVQAALAMHWFNPLVWLAARRVRIEREQACDEAVLGLGLRPCDYAEHLLRVVAGRPANRLLGATALRMADGGPFQQRLRWIIAFDGEPRRWTRKAMLACGAFTLALTVPLAMIRAGGPDHDPAAPTSADSTDDSPATFFQALAPKEPSSAGFSSAAKLLNLAEEESAALDELRQAGQLAGMDWSVLLKSDLPDSLPALAKAAGLEMAETVQIERLILSGRVANIDALTQYADSPAATETERTGIEKLKAFRGRQADNQRILVELRKRADLTEPQTAALARLERLMQFQSVPGIFSVRLMFVPDASGRSSWTQVSPFKRAGGEVDHMAMLRAAVGGRIPIQMAGSDDTLFYVTITGGDDRRLMALVTPGDANVRPAAERKEYQLERDHPVEISAGGHDFSLTFNSTWIARSANQPTTSTAHLTLTLRPNEKPEAEPGADGQTVDGDSNADLTPLYG